jgi:hypothetical protein
MFQVHVSTSSRVANHCKPFALSDASDGDFVTECDHEHDLKCDRCELIPSIFEEVESSLKDLLAIDNEEKNEMEYVITQSKKNIMAWKAHLLRDINQDEARPNLLRDLDPASVLVVLDWAMKFLPRKYRERQSDWFGKRGISWHIPVAMTKREDCLELLTFVHAFQSCTQDSPTVLAIIDDVVNQLKSERPEIKPIFFRQDNAGCYHSALNLLAMKQVTTKYKVELRVDFSDPQGGKGACDRKAATIKNKIKAYLNSSNDVETAKQMKMAIESRSGIEGVRVMLCDTPLVPSLEPLKWEGVSFVNNIAYCENGMKVWREYNFGQGKFREWSEFNLPETISIPHININEGPTSPKATFTDVKARKIPPAKPSHSANQPEVDGSSNSDVEEEISQGSPLFPCPENGCVKSFQRFSNLENHLDFGKHKYALERETFLDKAMLSYATKLDKRDISLECQTSDDLCSCRALDPLPKVWALKFSTVLRKRFSENQKLYLCKLFDVGEQTGHKVDSNNVSKSMRKACKVDGSFLFDASEYLTAKQIASFFSRLARKRRAVQVGESKGEGEEEELEAQLEEEGIENLATNIINEIGLIHPIMFDTYDLCDLATGSKFSKFSILMLQEICTFYDLDTSFIKAKRKKPYIEILTNFIGNCTCQG